MARLTFILGRAGAGKTEACLSAMAEAMERSAAGPPLLLLAPEHMTFQAERALAARMKGRGVMRGSVSGFRRLARRLEARAGAGTTARVTELGKRLLLKRIAQRRLKEGMLTALARGAGNRGFAAALSETIGELKSWLVSPEALRAAAGAAEDVYLGQKLSDIALLYEDFLGETRGRFEDAEDRMAALAAALPRCEEMRGAEVWLDGFIFFTPQERAVIRALLETAEAVRITLPLDRDVPRGARIEPSALFYRSAHTLQKLKATAEELGVRYEVRVLGAPRRFSADAPGLAAIERGLFRLPVRPEADAARGVRVVEAATRRLEMEAAAADMARLCREEGLRWRDIGVLLRDRESYGEIMGFTLSDYGIPFFSDRKRAGVHHPLAELVRSALGVVTGGWGYDEVFRCVKTDLLPVSRDEADVLENYVLAFGLRGEKRWAREWTYWRRRAPDGTLDEAAEAYLSEVNRVRAAVAAPFARLAAALGAEKGVLGRTRALYAFLTGLRVPETLAAWAAEAERTGALEEAKEHRMIWGAVMELFDQMASVSGEEEMPLSDYADVLGDGLDALEISLIPQGLDSVTVASFDQNSLNNVRALYILGANEGVMPRRPASGGLLTDADRARLAPLSGGGGLELPGGAAEESCAEAYLLYHGFTEARRYLWVSYALADSEGGGLSRSPLVARLLALLPALRVEAIPLEGMERYAPLLFTTGARAVSRLAPALREYRRNPGGAEADWAEVYNWALVHARERVARIVEGLFARAPEEALAPALASRIFTWRGRMTGSVTRFECYHACPFRHFAQYGLRLAEREEQGFRAPDLGVLLHEVMRRFGEKLRAEKLAWAEADGGARAAFVREALAEAAPRVQNEILLSTAQYRSLAARIARTAEGSLARLAALDGASAFHPVLFELSFGAGKEGGEVIARALPGGVRLDITGQIDRVDVGVVGDEGAPPYVLVVDYKTGAASLSFWEVYYGLRLQLLTYLIAAMRFLARDGRAARPAGVLYCALKNPVVETEEKQDAKRALEKQTRRLRMTGWLLDDAEVIRAVDRAQTYIRVKLAKDGAINKQTKEFVKTEAELRALARHTVKKLFEAGEAALSGDAGARPYRAGERNACAYCPFGAVCGFDEKLGFSYRTLDDKMRAFEETEQEETEGTAG